MNPELVQEVQNADCLPVCLTCGDPFIPEFPSQSECLFCLNERLEHAKKA